MAPTKIDYSKTIIYKVVPRDIKLKYCFVGSTTNPKRRKFEHQQRTNANEPRLVYKTIRENGGWAAWTMVLVEKFPCANGLEAQARERKWIEELGAEPITGSPVVCCETDRAAATPSSTLDYSRTVIYKIVPRDPNIKHCYVGSTTNFRNRKLSHQEGVESDDSRLVYKTIREKGGWDAWEMVELEKYPCADSTEARSRERKWMEDLGADLNSVRPIVSKSEAIEYKNAYREAHREHARARDRARVAALGESLRIKKREYHAAHREQILARQNRRVVCECGESVPACNLARHRRSNTHATLLASATGPEKEIVTN